MSNPTTEAGRALLGHLAGIGNYPEGYFERAIVAIEKESEAAAASRATEGLREAVGRLLDNPVVTSREGDSPLLVSNEAFMELRQRYAEGSRNKPAQPASEPEPLRDATPLDALRAIAEAAGNLVDTLADDPDGFWWEPEFRVLSDKLAALSGVTERPPGAEQPR